MLRTISEVLVPETSAPILYVSREARMRKPSVFEGLCRAAQPLGFSVKRIEEELKFARIDASARGVTGLALVAGLSISSLSFLAASLSGNSLLLLLGLVFCGLVCWKILSFPLQAAEAEHRRITSQFPEVVSQLLVSLRQNPSFEASMSFVVSCQEGRVREELEAVLADALRGKHLNALEAFAAFVARWEKRVPALKDVVYSIKASEVERSRAARVAILERALDGFLSALVGKFRDFVNSLITPVLILLNFCVLLPLIAFAVLPAILPVGLGSDSLAAMLALTLVAIYIYSSYTLQRKPPMAPELKPKLTEKKLVSFFGKPVPLVLFSSVLGSLIALPGVLHLLGYKGLIVDAVGVKPIPLGVAAGLGSYLWFSASAAQKERERIRRMEEEALDAFYQLGLRLEAHLSPEEAMRQVADSMRSSEISELFERTLKNLRERGMSLSGAFFDPIGGTLAEVRSGRLRSLVRLFLNSLERGCEVAAQVLINSVNYLARIENVRKEMRRHLAKPLVAALSVGVFVAPLVCGIAVCLQEVIQKGQEKALGSLRAVEELTGQVELGAYFRLYSSGLQSDHLELLLGIYVILLSALLTRFVVSLREGEDPVHLKLSVAKVCLFSVTVFLLVRLLAGPLILPVLS